MPPLTLHQYAPSGNCYKVRLTAAHLGLPLTLREYDILAGETRTPEFLATVDANGRIPVLQVGTRFLPESNAACWFLGDGSALIPADRFARAEVLRWLFWEQYQHEPNIATLRFWRTMIGEDRLTPAQRDTIPGKQAAGEAALALMDRHLASAEWMAGGAFSLADIALYAYTNVAGEGGVDLSPYPAGTGGLARVAARPGHQPM